MPNLEGSEIDHDTVAKLLLLGYDQINLKEYDSPVDFIIDWYPLLLAWPDRDKCVKLLQDCDLYKNMNEFRFIGPDTIVTRDIRQDRLNIKYKGDIIIDIYMG